jgi:PKD repeat protein
MQFLIFEKGRYLLTPMRPAKTLLFLITVIVFQCSLLAQSARNFDLHTSFAFEENKGQLSDQNILYYGKSNGTCVYCFKDHIAFVFEKETKYRKNHTISLPAKYAAVNDSVIVNASRLEMQFLQTNNNLSITAEQSEPDYNIFYTPALPNGAVVKRYNEIIYKEMYPHIDMVLHTNGSGLEYSFLVHPGGKPEDITIKWNGADTMKYNWNDRSIQLRNDLGFLREANLQVYQDDEPIQGAGYNVCANTVRFSIPQYNKQNELIIDPFLVWATYFGGSSNETAQAMAKDDSGNIYITGGTSSISSIASTGAFQTSASGGIDAFLEKFSSSGKRLWGTYFGGKNSDGASSSAIDNKGNIYISGFTETDTGLATSGAFQTRKIGLSDDAFIAKFSTSGKRIWSTYFGYQGYSNGICTDKNGNVAIIGECVVTDSRFYKYIASSGAYQTNYGGGATDAFIAKFSSSGNRLWSTFWGGEGQEYGNGITADSAGNLITIGYAVDTSSKYDVLATSGAYQTIVKGQVDAFISKFSASGNPLWSTYFGGYSTDEGKAITTDRSSNVYVTGSSSSDGFIAKFSSAGAFRWNYAFGGSGEVGNAITLDTIGSILTTGVTASTASIATKGAYQTNLGGGYDAFVLRLSPTGKRIWGTYYGGNSNEIGYGIAIDSSKYVYIGGTTSSSSGISTSGAFQTALSGVQDVFLAKFNYLPDNDAGIASISYPQKTICPGKGGVTLNLKNYGIREIDTVYVKYTVNGVKSSYMWTGKLKPDSIKVLIYPANFITGTDTVKAWTYLPNGDSDVVNENDTSKRIFTVFASPLANAGGNHAICYGSGIKIGSKEDSTLRYSWTSRPSGFTDSTSNPPVSPKTTTTYYLTVTNKVTGCTATDSAIITVNPLPLANTGQKQTTCLGDSVRLGDTAINGHSYIWYKTEKLILSTSSFYTVRPPSTTTYYLTETNNATGCSKTDSVTVRVISFTANVGKSHSTCYGSSTTIGSIPVVGHKYQWTSKPVGFTSTKSNPTVTPKVNTTYYLTETDSTYGCSHSDSVLITVKPLPTPNAGRDTVICAGSPVVLGSGQSASYSYSWSSIPAGFTSASRTISVNPIVSTHYIVRATDSNGCSNTDTVFIMVNPLPLAYIGAKGICPGDSIELGASPVAGHTYQWGSYPVGLNSTLSKIVVQPSVITAYFLTETDTLTGCSKSSSGKVFIYPVPKAANIGDKSICVGDRIAIGAGAVAGSSYTWTSKPVGFVSNVANPVVSPAVNTTYYIKEISATGCVNSDSLRITVKPIPTKPFAGKDQTICSGDDVFLSFSPDSSNTYQWIDGHGAFISSHSSIRMNPIDTTAYKLISTSKATGCSNSDTVIVNTIPYPQPRIVGKEVLCGADTARYTTALNKSNTYDWTITKGGNILSGQSTNSVLVQWVDTGIQYITVKETAAVGCSNSTYLKIEVHPTPVAHFTSYNGCTEQVIQFTDSSSFSDSVSWSFGDGGKSSERNPTHIYHKGGTYPVQETVFSKAGCSDTFIKNVIIYPFPEIKLFVIHDTGRSYTFSTNDSSELVYSWNFGDNSISDKKTELHNFKEDKAYNVHLTVANPNGCVLTLDTTIKAFYSLDKDSISIFPNPFADHISIYERLKENTTFHLLIYDAIGQQVAGLSQWGHSAGIHTDIFDAFGLAQGTYIVKLIVSDGEVIVKKMVKVGG